MFDLAIDTFSSPTNDYWAARGNLILVLEEIRWLGMWKADSFWIEKQILTFTRTSHPPEKMQQKGDNFDEN